MEKLVSSKGFTLVECCIVLVCISVFSLLILPIHSFSKDDWYLIPSNYLLNQSIAIRNSKKNVFEYEDEMIQFNETGNVSKAQTIHLEDDDRYFVIELGGGRLVERCSR